jgi:surfeit locus 1 family protein
MGQRRIDLKVVLASTVALALFLHLADWQWEKSKTVQHAYDQYEQRVSQPVQSIGARLLDGAQVQYLPVQVRGEYEPEGQFFLDNQQNNDVAGVHVITPLRIQGTSTRVLINRGWVAWGVSRQQLPHVPVPSGIVQVQGLAFVPNSRLPFGVSDPQAGRTEPLRMRLDLLSYAQNVPDPVQPFVILQNEHDANDGLIRHWSAPENKSTMHRGYAIQWLLISLALLVGVLYSWRTRRQEPGVDAQ